MTELIKPKGFKDLDAAELYRSALEDFAIPVEAEDKTKKKVLLAAFLESGVEWADYVAQHPEVRDEEAEKEQAMKDKLRQGSVITSDDVSPSKAAPVAEEEVTIRVKEALPVAEKYLIKMVRDNPLFETCGYKFTQTHPYALVSPEAAEFILTKEDGFRQATPSELQEFYG